MRIESCVKALLIIGAVVVSCTPNTRTEPTPQSSDMDKLLASIALYPDALLAQIFTAATSPEQVTDLQKWLETQTELSGSDLQTAAEEADFQSSYIALVIFPEVVSMMAENIDWTTEIGVAFLSDPTAVMESVQRLRQQAMDAGNLKSTPEQDVNVETQDGAQVIVIQPTNPQIVYVPVYNTQTVYVAAPPSHSNDGDVAAAAVVGFTLGVIIGAAIADDDDYYYGHYGWGAWGMHWHGGGVYHQNSVWVVHPNPHYHYAHAVPNYRPNVNVYAPTNINVNRQRTTNRTSVNKSPTRSPNNTQGPVTANKNTASAGRSTTTTKATPAKTNQFRGVSKPSPRATPTAAKAASGSSAFGGYQKGGTTRAASSRGQASAKQGGGGRKRP